MGTQPEAGVGDLIMVLEKSHEYSRLQVQRRGPTPLALPLVILPLVEEAILEGRDDFLWRAVIIGVIGLAASGQGYHGAVMKVVVPERIEAITALF
jgi:hypothetical protein